MKRKILITGLLLLILTTVPGAFSQSKPPQENQAPFLYSIQGVDINTQYSEFGPAFYLNKLVFTSGKRNYGKVQLRYKSTGEYLTDLYVAELEDNFPVKSQDFPHIAQVRLNESTTVFTGDAKTMYFTRNHTKKNSKGISTLKICKANLIEGKWKEITDLPFNDIEFNTAHPALSPDGTALYFSSDRPGSLGDTDIFKVTINKDGSFGSPENLDKAINTSGRDSFPFISDENILYFASSGHGGYGGLDVFSSKIHSDGTFGPVLNMGPVINSLNDDFSLVFNSRERIGFFASNREGGKGADDLYRFTENKIKEIPDNPQIIPEEQAVAATKEIPDALKKDSIAQSKQTIAASPAREKEIKLQAQKVYFEFGKSQLKADNKKTQKALQAIMAIVARYPNAMFNIKGHADNIGKEKVNMVLSKKRARNVETQLIKLGVQKEAIVYVKGYGESKPVENNRSTNGRALNRRVEIIPVISQEK